MGWLLLIPFLLLRFGLLFALDRDAVRRAAHFAPLQGGERLAYWVYQLSTAAIFLALLLLRIKTAPHGWSYGGLAVYGAGCALLAASLVNFASPGEDGMNCRGLYRLSRNPMYVAYFLVFLGCAMLTQSLLLLGFVLAFQGSAHWIILAEERWCAARFGEAFSIIKKTCGAICERRQPNRPPRVARRPCLAAHGKISRNS